jgi:ankyrin repeat protein
MIRKYTAYSSWNDALSRFPQCLDIEIQDGSTLLHLAALDENISAMDFLVHHSVPVDVGNAMRATPLMVAAYKGCRTSVEWLLNHGANVDAKDIF